MVLFLTEDGLDNFLTEDGLNKFELETATIILPDPPTSLTATAITSDQINLAWVAPTFIGTGSITGYKIERESPEGNGFSTLIADTGSTDVTYSDTGLVMNTEYNYRISTITTDGTSATASNENKGTTINVDAPTSLSAVAGTSDQINLTWVAPLITGGVAITGYKIERESPEGNGFSTLVADTGSTDLSYSDTGLTMNTEYNYRVSAITSLDTGDASTTSKDTTLLLDVPTLLTATPQTRKIINLAWITPVTDGGSTITGYKIEREITVGGGFSTLVASTGSTDVTYSDINLISNTEYNYRVSAITDLDVSSPSNEASTTTLNEDEIRNRHGEIFIRNNSVTNTSKPSNPTYALVNGLQKTVQIKSLFLIPTRNFTQKGSIGIEVAGRRELVDLEESTILKDVGLFHVPLVNTLLKANQSLKIFAWNNTDSEQVTVKVLVGVNKAFPNPDQFVRDQIKEVTGNARITSGDGGTSKAVYTVPANKRARIKKIVTHITGVGSASIVELHLGDAEISQWQWDSKDPNNYSTSASGNNSLRSILSSQTVRKVWSTSYAGANIPYEDGVGIVLEAGEIIKYDGNFSSTFNATIDYAYSIEEEDL